MSRTSAKFTTLRGTTTTGIDSQLLGQRRFDLVVIDEACQSTEPGCWIPLLRGDRLVLAGDPPSPLHPPAGCAFHPRCPYAQEKCRAAVPPLLPAGPDREAACVRLDEI